MKTKKKKKLKKMLIIIILVKKGKTRRAIETLTGAVYAPLFHHCIHIWPMVIPCSSVGQYTIALAVILLVPVEQKG